MSQQRVILSVNGGSSSLKLALFRLADSAESELVRATARRDEQGRYRLVVDDHSAIVDSQCEALRGYAALAREIGLPPPDAVGHRLVHGGADFSGPAVLDDDSMSRLRKLTPLAPLHLPLEIELIETAREVFPDRAQVGCFDTAFHSAMPLRARMLPLSRGLWEKGVRRYGFHGLSYEYVLAALGGEAYGRIVIAHLGAGASLAAVRDGCPVDTTMGMTPTGGLMMGERCGDLDPGALIHLLRQEGSDADGLDRLVNHESGLAGVSGLGGDMRTLLQLAPNEPAAAEAIDLYCHIARKHIAAMTASLGGIDQLVFTAGVGECSSEIRARICRGLEFLGLEIDPELNERNAPVISPAPYFRKVRVVETNEELMVARQTRGLTLTEAGA